MRFSHHTISQTRMTMSFQVGCVMYRLKVKEETVKPTRPANPSYNIFKAFQFPKNKKTYFRSQNVQTHVMVSMLTPTLSAM